MKQSMLSSSSSESTFSAVYDDHQEQEQANQNHGDSIFSILDPCRVEDEREDMVIIQVEKGLMICSDTNAAGTVEGEEGEKEEATPAQPTPSSVIPGHGGYAEEWMEECNFLSAFSLEEEKKEELTECNSLQASSSATVNEDWVEEDKNLPAGYRFSPEEEDLVMHYLASRILGYSLPSRIIEQIDLYSYDPEELPIGPTKRYVENEAYFFTNLEPKYTEEIVPRRTTKTGYWEATSDVKQIFSGDDIIGFKRRFVFYKGTEQGAERTRWTLHEYWVNPKIFSEIADTGEHSREQMKSLVVCKIKKTVTK